ncbi:MAG: malectin domain-containing carbohydrate-binding protein, partial [Candidatus Hydrogenedentota bacterium]
MWKAAVLGLCVMFGWGALAAPKEILVPEDAPPVVKFAAAEARRYIYVRTGTLLPIVETEEVTHDAIVVGSMMYVPASDPPRDIDDTPWDAARLDQEYVIKTVSHRDCKLVVIAGSSDIATLYGVYRFAELLGVRFYLHGDVIPDERIPFKLPDFDIEEIPLFATRGILPFHDFPEGPDWWNLDDYKAIIGQLPKLRMNFIGLHTYPEDRPNAEPTVWIGRPDDANSDGTVEHGYPAIYYNTALPVGWGLSPKATGDYPLGAADMYDRDDFGSDIMRGLSPRPDTPDECVEVFNRTGAMFREAFAFARFVGVKTCIGTETPLTVPREVRKRYAPGLRKFQAIGGKTAHYDNPIKGTALDAVYQSVRFDLDGYTISVPDGFYTVTLHFSEVAYNEMRSRVFDVKIEGITAIDNLDIYARVGKDAALDVSFEMVRVADGTLNIDFVEQIEYPAIAGISVTGEDVNIHINCGGPGVGQFIGDDGSAALDPATVQELYAGMFQRIMAAHPLDYYWFWTPETWTWQGAQSDQVKDTIADIELAIAAASEVEAPFTLATCGWVLGPQDDRALFGRVLPPAMPVSCINRSVGHAPVEPGFADVENRAKWAIPWLEDDPAMVSPQLWVGRMRRDAYDALRYGCTGLLGIHWRTRILGPNVSALATAAWDQEPWAPDPEGPIQVDGGETTRFDGIDFADTEDNALYQTLRYGMNAYRFTVPDGTYSVTLHLCEPHYDSPGERVFSIEVEGVKAAERLDIFKEAGKNSAVRIQVNNVAVSDGVLDVVFTDHKGLPVVSAIEVVGAAADLRVNCGGEAYKGFSADVETLRHLISVDFYEDWAVASFGEE